MLDVFFTVDVEVWCGGWERLDERFPAAFRQYVYGPTPAGDYGLPYQVRVLAEHGLTGVYFVEPLFSARFGLAPLAEIVGLLREAGQEVELHLHTEWVDEAREPLLPGVTAKRQHLRYFDVDEQARLIAYGAARLAAAGGGEACAFRAGSFAFNRDTLVALARNGIALDSSYNACHFGRDSGVASGTVAVEPFLCEGVHEYPMTVFDDGTGLRHAQLTACSAAELERLLWQAAERERRAFVLLFHNFELLNVARSRRDDVMVRRFRRLCAFLARHRDVFRVRGFRGLAPQAVATQPAPLRSPLWRTGARVLEQVWRRSYG